MPRKGEPLSEEHKAKLAAGRAAKKTTAENKNPENQPTPPTPATEPASTELGYEQLAKMVRELQEKLEASNAVSEAYRQGQSSAQPQQPQVRGIRQLFSEDLSVYESPVPRLLQEPRLQRIAFEHNYDLEYQVSMTRAIDKKDGSMERQPQFNIELQGVIFDDDGEPTSKRFVARKMTFFEDPDTAIHMAEKAGLSMDNFNGEQDFLNQMRYMRVRDWLFDFFWPKPSDGQKTDFKDEVIGGQVVRTFQKAVDADRAVKVDYEGLSGSKLR